MLLLFTKNAKNYNHSAKSLKFVSFLRNSALLTQKPILDMQNYSFPAVTVKKFKSNFKKP